MDGIINKYVILVNGGTAPHACEMNKFRHIEKLGFLKCGIYKIEDAI